MPLGDSRPLLDILIVDDEPNIRRTLSLHLEGVGHRVRTASSVGEALVEIQKRRFDLALVDLRLGLESGLDLMPKLTAEDPAIKILAITAYASVETAVEAMKRGARDYLSKPFTPAELDLAIAKLVELSRLERKVEALESDLAEADPNFELASESPAMRALLDLARRAADGDARLLIRGESGTGKGVLARAIHGWSPRRGKPFVTVSCPSLPAELLESELFGRAKGAFTGATSDSAGRVALAEGGTLLLDEIGDLPLTLQPKLLRFVQDREYERVGDPATRRADVRILAATHQDLEAAVGAGRFREDLLYRLDVLTLEIPPLRARREDVLPLARRLLALFGRQYGRPKSMFTPAAERALAEHPWPGNVRELRSAIERAAMLAGSTEIGPELLLLKGATAPAPTAGPSLGDLVPLAEIEREHVERVVARAGSLKEAAEILGIDPATLWRRRKVAGG
ncbi:MAG: sigma-54 dependent transcriptional regulator [Acidobacteriota bacterium]